MNLNTNNFFKGSFNYRTEPNGPVMTVPRLSYESHGRLYDVIMLPVPVYQINWKTVNANPIHRAILKYFQISTIPNEVN